MQTDGLGYASWSASATSARVARAAMSFVWDRRGLCDELHAQAAASGCRLEPAGTQCWYADPRWVGGSPLLATARFRDRRSFWRAGECGWAVSFDCYEHASAEGHKHADGPSNPTGKLLGVDHARSPATRAWLRMAVRDIEWLDSTGRIVS